MSIETPSAASFSPIRSPVVSRSSSLAGKPRKPSPLRRSSTPEDSQLRLKLADERSVGEESEEEENEQGETDVQQQGRRASDGQALAATSPSTSTLTASQITPAFTNASTSKSTSHLAGMSYDIAPRTTTTLANSKYTLPPIRPHPKFPHSTSIRPMRPLSSVTGGTSAPHSVGSLTSVPHAGQGTSKAPQRQKIIVPAKSWKACFDLNLTQKELARFD
ncbi:hypothetical protein NliqN6_4828 [Naganishia liquefaciens]|uniref:Uncharacterized protein n=1 Tax=Naganishia liquefaciens TaxID=104408 RepID=A0A8H3TVP3_9TREE|nr:hypothetical protein NliqN6_4828 [Naganishia liquefaciens]